MRFLDSNVLIYAFSADARTPIAQDLLQGSVIGVQGLNEFTVVARRKLDMSWDEITQAVDAILSLCGDPHPITLAAHRNGVRIADRHRLAFYDSVMLATAIDAGAESFITEDMHDGLVIDGRLTIRNPFSR